MNRIRRILMIEIGTFLLALAIGMFILPGKILTGGVAGITSILSKYVTISEDIITIIINIALFVIGSMFLGKEFFFNTLVFSVSYPFMILFVTRVLPSYEVEPLLASIYGGLIGGIGVGLMFRNGGSSGGTDAIALIAEKYLKVKVNHVVMVMDALTVLAGLYTYGLNAVLIGLISVILTGYALEKALTMYSGVEGKKFEIISDKYEEISSDILNILARGTTIMDIQGGFTGQKKKMLVVIVSEEQFSAVKEIISKHDPNAFVIISNMTEVNGEGFTYEHRI